MLNFQIPLHSNFSTKRPCLRCSFWVTSSYSNYTVNVDSFDNAGSVVGTGDYIGGLFGYMYFNEGYSYTVFMTELHNSADVSGKAYVGGLIGYGETDSDKSSLVDSTSTGTVNGTSNYDKIAGKLVKISK